MENESHSDSLMQNQCICMLFVPHFRFSMHILLTYEMCFVELSIANEYIVYACTSSIEYVIILLSGCCVQCNIILQLAAIFFFVFLLVKLLRNVCSKICINWPDWWSNFNFVSVNAFTHFCNYDHEFIFF